MSQTACPTMVGRTKAQKMPSLETDTIIVGMSPFRANRDARFLLLILPPGPCYRADVIPHRERAVGHDLVVYSSWPSSILLLQSSPS